MDFDLIKEEAREFLERAQHDLDVARSNFDDEYFPDAVNRSYYGVFHAVKALFSSRGISAKTHRGLIRQFGREFVKTRLLDKKMASTMKKLEEERTRADYVAEPDFTEKEVQECLSEAEEFLDEICQYLKEK